MTVFHSWKLCKSDFGDNNNNSVHFFHMHVSLYSFSPSICCPWFRFGSLHTDFPLTRGACCLWTLGLSVMKTVDLDLSLAGSSAVHHHHYNMSMLDASLHPCSSVTIVASPITIIVATYLSYPSLSPPSFTWPHLLPYPPTPLSSLSLLSLAYVTGWAQLSGLTGNLNEQEIMNE